MSKLVDNHDQALAPLDEVQRAAIAPALGARLRGDVDLAANHVREQGKAEQEWQAEKLQQAAARDAVAHADDPDLHDRHLATGENSIAQQARILNLPETEIGRQIADYKSAVHVATIDALARRNPLQAAECYARYRGDIEQPDSRRVAAALASTGGAAFPSTRDDFTFSSAGDQDGQNDEINEDFSRQEDRASANAPVSMAGSVSAAKGEADKFTPPTTPPPGWDPALDVQIDHLAGEISAEIISQPDSRKIEHAAFIWRQKDGVLHRTALTTGTASNSWVTGADFEALKIPADAEIVAIIHNHPSLIWSPGMPSMGVPGRWDSPVHPEETAKPSAKDYAHWYSEYVAKHHAPRDNFRAYMIYDGRVHKYNLWQQDPHRVGGSMQATWAVESDTYRP